MRYNIKSLARLVSNEAVVCTEAAFYEKSTRIRYLDRFIPLSFSPFPSTRTGNRSNFRKRRTRLSWLTSQECKKYAHKCQTKIAREKNCLREKKLQSCKYAQFYDHLKWNIAICRIIFRFAKINAASRKIDFFILSTEYIDKISFVEMYLVIF